MGTAHETSFAGLLKQLRLSAGLTQEKLAEQASLSAKTVSNLECHPDRSPFLETVTLLADALFLQPDDRARLMQAARPETSLPAPDLLAVEEKVHSAPDLPDLPDLPARYPAPQIGRGLTVIWRLPRAGGVDRQGALCT